MISQEQLYESYCLSYLLTVVIVQHAVFIFLLSHEQSVLNLVAMSKCCFVFLKALCFITIKHVRFFFADKM